MCAARMFDQKSWICPKKRHWRRQTMSGYNAKAKWPPSPLRLTGATDSSNAARPAAATGRGADEKI